MSVLLVKRGFIVALHQRCVNFFLQVAIIFFTTTSMRAIIPANQVSRELAPTLYPL